MSAYGTSVTWRGARTRSALGLKAVTTDTVPTTVGEVATMYKSSEAASSGGNDAIVDAAFKDVNATRLLP